MAQYPSLIIHEIEGNGSRTFTGIASDGEPDSQPDGQFHPYWQGKVQFRSGTTGGLFEVPAIDGAVFFGLKFIDHSAVGGTTKTEVFLQESLYPASNPVLEEYKVLDTTEVSHAFPHSSSNPLDQQNYVFMLPSPILILPKTKLVVKTTGAIQSTKKARIQVMLGGGWGYVPNSGIEIRG